MSHIAGISHDQSLPEQGIDHEQASYHDFTLSNAALA